MLVTVACDRNEGYSPNSGDSIPLFAIETRDWRPFGQPVLRSDIEATFVDYGDGGTNATIAISRWESLWFVEDDWFAVSSIGFGEE